MSLINRDQRETTRLPRLSGFLVFG